MQEIPKTYDPKSIDAKWYQEWEQSGCFTADPKSDKEKFSFVLPPPNVTGQLHMGHAFEQTLSDVLVRFKRMQGFEVLWLPGTDHAGIATQTVVEQHLIKTMGKTRKDFSREEFLKFVWDWKEQKQVCILSQLRKMGSSLDWSKLRFTLDETSSKAVRHMFKKLYDEGLIYQGSYLVNWDPVNQTALADDEVEYEERDTFLWHFRYPLKDGSGHITIATTRPETILGDTAVAVSPKDARYKDLVGKTLLHPLVDREIPLIADEYVDPEFGTGAVKMTPAHDPNDYEIAIRHNLPLINILTPDGQINENGESFAGLSKESAREKVVEALEEQGLFVKKEPYTHRVGISYRSKAIIEPFMSKQWFIKMEGFAKRLQSALENDKIQFLPKSWSKTYLHWVENLRDWCISRQLWWGHRIPIWHHKTDPKRLICHDGEDLPDEVKENPEEWRQEEDVLDTWFSSALWPFSTLGWPDKTDLLESFYPHSTLITGHDILFFWVARMLLMGEHALGKLPFPEVYLHGLIFAKSYWTKDKDGHTHFLPPEECIDYDLGKKPLPSHIHSKWEKMSKTKGNVIDPLEMIDQYGTDALRMALCASASLLPQIDLDRRRFEDYKNFTNKVWNGARFVFMNLQGDKEQGLAPLSKERLGKGLDLSLLKLEDRWILASLSSTIKQVVAKIGSYNFDQATSLAYNFFWKNFCSYYVEISKPYLFGKKGSKEERENKQVLLALVLLSSVRLLHPMAPFITEELFSMLKDLYGSFPLNTEDSFAKEGKQALDADYCMLAPFPKELSYEELFEGVEETFSILEQTLYNIRYIRGEMKIPPGQKTDIYIIGSEENKTFQEIEENQVILHALTRVKEIHFVQESPKDLFGSLGAVQGVSIFIPLPSELVEKEKKRLEKERVHLETNIEKLRTKLENPKFLERAPSELVEKQKQILERTLQEHEAIVNKISSFS